MKKKIISLLRQNPRSRLLLERHFLDKHYLKDSGWAKSILTYSAVDRKGLPLPWITYSAIHFLENRIQPDHFIFEYGSGNSTLWLAKRSKKIISIEHDLRWYDKMKASIEQAGIMAYKHIDLGTGDYETEISSLNNTVDILFIDGRNRVKCCINGLPSLSNRGVILFDNSERPDYIIAIKRLKEEGFKCIDFSGLGPISDHGWCTSIFYKPDNCLDI